MVLFLIMDKDIKHLEKILKVFANSRRLFIVKLLLRKKEMSVGQVAKALKLSFKATSKHLVALSNIDILDKRQEGLSVYYRINSSANKTLKALLSLVS